MASTKIINVLKDDKFEEILDLFKNASAQEVIFVLPKTSRAFKNEEHFIILQNEAVKLDKKISLLCSSPEINKLADKYKFDVLLAKNNDDKTLITTANRFDLKVSVNDEEEEIDKTLQEDNDDDNGYQAITVSKTNRGLEDIIKQEGTPIKIVTNKERPMTLAVKKKPASQPVDEIKNVWKEQSERIPIENIWAGINNNTKKSFKNFPKKLLIILGIISIVMFGTIIYISTGSAKIDITPSKQPLDLQLKISSSDKFSFVDVGLHKIPGQLFNIEKSATQTFSTTGEKEVAQKSRGKITVFNEYGTTPQVLIATTRFQTQDGLIFRTLKGVTVPGTKVENGKIIPGSISVEVIADKAGQSYNILASKFTIPAFNERGDAGRYEKIYGKSSEDMKGGIIGKAKIVTEYDSNTAKQVLSDQVVKDVENSLKTQTAGLKVINSSAIKLGKPDSTAKIDEAFDNLTMTISGFIKTVGFKEDDLMELVKQYIEKSENLTVVNENLTINYDNVVLDDGSNTLSFTLNIKGNGYTKIDSDKIKNDLSGKNEKEIKDYFKDISDIESVKVILSPFWVKKIPQNKGRTNLS